MLEALECRQVTSLDEQSTGGMSESMDHSRFLGSIETAVGSCRRAADQVERHLFGAVTAAGLSLTIRRRPASR